MSGLLGGPIFLAGVTAPSGLNHARAQVGRQFHRPVCGSAVQNQDFIAAAEAFDGARDIALFVERNDRRGDLH